MASEARCFLPRGHGRWLAAVLALAALAALRHPAAAAVAAEASGPSWHVVSVSLLLPSAAVCTAAATASNSSAHLRVVHRHGPCSPLQPRGVGGGAPSHAEVLDRDRDRVDHIHRKIAAASAATTGGSARAVTVPAHWGTSLGFNNYVVTVGLGTPARHLAVEFDTGSDLSWVQCAPCAGCYRQQDPLFDPARSSTYSAVPCGARECQGFLPQDCGAADTDGQCPYVFSYADQSQTVGFLARDTLTLARPSARPGPGETLPGFVFGCGEADAGLFGRADGLIGLGRGEVSLASQAAAAGGYGAGLFSYCLPSTPTAAGYLSLGDAAAAAKSDARFTFTAMATRPEMPSLYYLDLVGIRVAGRDTGIPPAVFAAGGGTIIDSGTVIGRLPPRAYAALRSAFARAMASRGYRKAHALSDMDTCYDLTGRATVRVPSVELVFADGAAVSLGARGVLYVASVSQVCLAFAPIDDETAVGIVGNTQQKTFAVVYDVANRRIGFGAKGCA